jgi:hypothetical protein
MHDRRFVHGGVSVENQWLRADGTTEVVPQKAAADPGIHTEAPISGVHSGLGAVFQT